MLYDIPRNFIGDTHWQESNEVEDGDEVTLEKAGVLVQIQERTETLQADLTGLWQSRQDKANDTRARVIAGQGAGDNPARGAFRQGTLVPRDPNRTPKTPRPMTGRATLSTKSPHEEREAQLRSALTRRPDRTYEEGPATKRPRNDENHVPLWQLLRASNADAGKIRNPDTCSSSVREASALDIRRDKAVANEQQESNTSKKRNAQAKQGRLQVTKFVDLTESSPQKAADQDLRIGQRTSPVSNSTSNRRQRDSGNGWFRHPPEGSRNGERFVPRTDSIAEPSPVVDAADKTGARAGVAKNVQSARLIPNSERQQPRPKPKGRSQQISLPNPSTLVLQRGRNIPSSPPVSTTNRILPVAPYHNATPKAPPTNDQTARADPERPTAAKQSLRVISKRQRKMLMCEAPTSVPVAKKSGHEGTGQETQVTATTNYEKCRPGNLNENAKSITGGTDETASLALPRSVQTTERSPLVNPNGANDEITTAPETLPPHVRLDAEILGYNTGTRANTEGPPSREGDHENDPLESQHEELDEREQVRADEDAPQLKPTYDRRAGNVPSGTGKRGPERHDRPAKTGKAQSNVQHNSIAAARGRLSNVQRAKGKGEARAGDTEPTRSDANADARQQVAQSADDEPDTELSVEKGPWTREAFDLFGVDIPRMRQQKSGKTIDWLARYATEPGIQDDQRQKTTVADVDNRELGTSITVAA